MPRFPYIDKAILFKLRSYDKRFRKADSINELLEQYVDKNSLDFIGFSAFRAMLKPNCHKIERSAMS